jgi:SNF2 family DNA or RNA helicase
MSGHIVYSYREKEGAADEVHSLLQDIAKSIRKEDVLRLPGQIYEDIELTAPPSLLKEYKQFEKDRVMECLDAEGEIVAGSAATLTNKLLQFANGAIYDQDGKTHILHDIKLDALEELLEEAGGDSVLVLYNYKHDADRIRERIQCRALDTSEDIDAWNRGEIPVALAHPASIGHGLNLQEGGHIIVWYGLTWSLELYQQANERLNRPGQKNVCRIYHLTLKGTHDERVLTALKNKEKGQDAAIEALRLEIVKK